MCACVKYENQTLGRVLTKAVLSGNVAMKFKLALIEHLFYLEALISRVPPLLTLSDLRMFVLSTKLITKGKLATIKRFEC